MAALNVSPSALEDVSLDDDPIPSLISAPIILSPDLDPEDEFRKMQKRALISITVGGSILIFLIWGFFMLLTGTI